MAGYEDLTDDELYQLAARKIARKYELDPDLFEAQIGVESRFNPQADSGKAYGIAQFTPPTAQQYGVDPSDPLSSLDGAARYMRDLLQQNGGDWQRAATAYHSGQRNVDQGTLGPAGQAYAPTIEARAASLRGPETAAPAPSPSLGDARALMQQTSRPVGEAPPPAPEPRGLARYGIPTVSQAIGMPQPPNLLPDPLDWLPAPPSPRTGALLAVPPMASAPLEMLAVGGTNAVMTAADRLRQRVDASQGHGFEAVLDGVQHLDATDAEAIGRDALIGAGAVGVARLVGRLVFGPREPLRREAEATLRQVSGARPPNALAGAPSTNAYGRSDSPYTRGQALAEYAEGFGKRYLMAPDPEAVNVAYAAIGNRQVATDGINTALAAVRRQAEKEGLLQAVPSSILDDLPPVAGVQDVLARRNGLREVMRMRADGSRLVTAGLAKKANALYTQALEASVSGPELAALKEAETIARQNAIARTTQELFEGAQDATLGLNGKGLTNRLLKNEADYRGELGDLGYTGALQIARAFQTLQQKPNGRPWAQRLARVLVGGAVGGAGAAAIGVDPKYGVLAGVTGGGLSAIPGLLINPWFGETVEALARMEPGSRKFLQTAGRLSAAAMAARQSVEQEPAPPAPLAPIETPRPAPTGRVPMPRPTHALLQAAR